jgi:hypothetical protein
MRNGARRRGNFRKANGMQSGGEVEDPVGASSTFLFQSGIENTGRGLTELSGRDPIHSVSITEEEISNGRDALDRGDLRDAEEAMNPHYPRLGREIAANDPDIGDLGVRDLRIGGVDDSGVSEWSMRQHSPRHDDGFDQGDFLRSDHEISEQIQTIIDGIHADRMNIDFSVAGGVVTLSGYVEAPEDKDVIEEYALQILGVEEVRNQIQLRE